MAGIGHLFSDLWADGSFLVGLCHSIFRASMAYESAADRGLYGLCDEFFMGLDIYRDWLWLWRMDRGRDFGRASLFQWSAASLPGPETVLGGRGHGRSHQRRPMEAELVLGRAEFELIVSG